MLFEAQVLTTQAIQQFIERADNDVRLVLSRRSKPCRQIQVLHQFHATYECIVGAYGLLIKEPQVTEHQYDKTFRSIEQPGVGMERSIQTGAGYQDDAQTEDEEVIL